MTNYSIDIVSDTVCPWYVSPRQRTTSRFRADSRLRCYVGKNRLGLAIKQHQATYPDDTFKTSWHPFYLNPNAPKNVDKQAYYESKFGAQRTKVMQAHLAKLGREVGIAFNFGGKTGNTRDSHRLIQLGKTKSEEQQTKVVEQLFNSYFEDNEDITDREVLIARGVKAGLEEQEVREWMESDKGGPEVDKEVAQAQSNFISGVPNFTINGQYEIQGAEEPSAFVRVFGEIKSRGGGAGGTESVNGANTC
jgi:predicted DsbA family dithiol-disulfide isomerase